MKSVRAEVTIPLAVKVSPFFTNFANMAKRFEQAGASGLVLFNRFYQPDIDLESLEPRPNILLSTPMAMRLPLRWIALLAGKLNVDLAASRGVHRGADALKMLMVGADAVMLCSTLIRHGIQQFNVIERDIVTWMEEHQYQSVEQLKGSVSQKNCPDPPCLRAGAIHARRGQLPRLPGTMNSSLREIEKYRLKTSRDPLARQQPEVRVSCRFALLALPFRKSIKRGEKLAETQPPSRIRE